MLVKDRMTRHFITIRATDSFHNALRLIKEHRVTALPVIDEGGQLVGIVTEKDLLHAAPSPTTSLSIYEVNYLLSKTLVAGLMSKPVISVEQNLPLEEAARLMVDNKISSLVVTSGAEVVGMITETDIFAVLVEMLGGGQASTRITVRISERKGSLAELAARIAQAGGNIHSLATFAGDDPEHRFIAARVAGIDPNDLGDQVELINVWNGFDSQAVDDYNTPHILRL